MNRSFTPDTLATRWGVSATTVRTMCEDGRLAHFRIGKLYRIPAATVEEFENWQISQSADSVAVSASRGQPKESASAISLRHAPERKQKPRGATDTLERQSVATA
jgi:excisionase family DNA binding protein